MERSEIKRKARLLRHRRVRKKVEGRERCPRLSVFRSGRHIYAQIIDDTRGHTLASASTLDKELKTKLEGLKKREQAKLVGETLARRANSRGVTRVVFDRGGYRYHGRVRSLAEGAREAGLEF